MREIPPDLQRTLGHLRRLIGLSAYPIDLGHAYQDAAAQLGLAFTQHREGLFERLKVAQHAV
jgi:hypothetical protein